ncbi:hypothetical protein TcBrA4_0139800 [Trypanosoma cruzi]|nr:hypothetical protein TcBrA4_0139800 [Trypanosoma cruzi]
MANCSTTGNWVGAGAGAKLIAANEECGVQACTSRGAECVSPTKVAAPKRTRSAGSPCGESQLKEARRMPLLQKRLNTALTEREELECQLAETRGREARLSDEVKLLRMFIKISENPEIAETARQYVSHERIQVELKVLGEQLRSIATERDEYKKRVLLSCEEAECYRDKWNASLEEKRKLRNT